MRSASGRAACSRPNPGMMTLDGTNTLGAARARRARSVVIDPGPIEDGHVDELDEQTGDVAPGAADPPPLRPLRGRRRARDPQGLPGARPRPGVLLPRRPAGGRRGDRRRRAASCGWSPRPATPPTRSRSWSRPSGRCSPATWCSAAVRRWSPTRTASSAPTSTRSSGCARWPRRARWRRSGPPTARCSTTRSARWSTTSSHRRQRLAQVEAALAQLGVAVPGRRRRGPAPPGRRDRLPGRRRVALGRGRAVGPRPARLPRRRVESGVPCASIRRNRGGIGLVFTRETRAVAGSHRTGWSPCGWPSTGDRIARWAALDGAHACRPMLIDRSDRPFTLAATSADRHGPPQPRCVGEGGTASCCCGASTSTWTTPRTRRAARACGAALVIQRAPRVRQ